MSINEVVEGYYKCWPNDVKNMERFLASDMKFRGPMESHDSSQSFISSCQKMAESGQFNDCEIIPQSRVVQGNELVHLYEMELGGKRLPMAEHFQVEEGKIKRINLYFDSKKMLS